MMNKRSHSPEETPVSTSTAAAGTMEEENTSNKRAKGDGDDWEALFQKLATYKQHHGHCNVPAQNDDDPELGIWVAKLRELHKNSETHMGHTDEEETLTEDQMAKLTQIGFEWQPRNPRHLQWETRFSQLQSFKKKYGHAQVPIGWPENVQLANWVSKQRQEYKNLLRGRTTRLDENRIRLLNSIGFAWQLQRGGRRRQLKARAKDDKGKHGASAGSDGEASTAGSDKGQGGEEDTEGPCILPGEVLIGQGASTPMSPVGASGSAAAAGAPGDGPRKKLRDGHSKGVVGLPFAAAGGGMAQQQGPGQPLSQSILFQQMQQRQQMAPSSMNQNGMGLPFLGVGNQGGVPGNQNDLLEFMLARNALYQNLQRPQASARTSLQMLGAAGAGAFSRMNSMQTGQNGQAQMLSATQNAQSQLLAAQRSSLLPMLAPGAPFYSGDGMGQTGLLGNNAGGAGAGMDPPTRRSIGGNSVSDESKLPMGARGFAEDHQQQQQQQYFPNLLRFPSSGGASNSSRMDAPGTVVGSPNIGSSGMQQQQGMPQQQQQQQQGMQQQQAQGGNRSFPNNFSN